MTFEEKVEEYGKLDTQIKDLTKTLDTEKAEIKKYMIQSDMKEYISAGFKVMCVSSTTEKMNEAAALKILKDFWESEHDIGTNCPFVQVVETLNHSALESALYHNDLPDDVLAKLNSCITRTTVNALKCSKIKNK